MRQNGLQTLGARELECNGRCGSYISQFAWDKRRASLGHRKAQVGTGKKYLEKGWPETGRMCSEEVYICLRHWHGLAWDTERDYKKMEGTVHLPQGNNLTSKWTKC